MSKKRITIIALAVVAVVAVGGWTWWNSIPDGSVATASGHKVSAAELEKSGKDFGRPLSGDAPDSVSCPGAMQAKKGETAKCTAVFDGKKKSMEITADEVKGDQVTLSFFVKN